MASSIYTVMSGAREIMKAQARVANNLANLNTTGFRADLTAMKQQAVNGPGFDSRVFPVSVNAGVDLSPGQKIHTGRDLDIAVSNDGYIAVQASDGSEAYTRAGNLKVSQSGLVTTGAGFPVLGNGGPIAIPPAEKIEIGVDGTISVRPVGQEASTLAVVDRIKLVKPDLERLQKNPDGLLHLPDGDIAPPDAQVRVESGQLESSNVNPVEAMIQMMDFARQFEMQVKMMQTSKEQANASAELLRVGA